MKVHRLDVPAGELADPLSDAWSGVEAEVVELGGAPLDDQPSRYIREAYAGESIGAVAEVEVRIAESAGQLLIRLAWDDADEDRSHRENAFPDASAVMFPLQADASVESMGSTEQPVGLWYWRPDLEDEASELVAKGLGSVEPVPAADRGQALRPLLARRRAVDGRVEARRRRPCTRQSRPRRRWGIAGGLRRVGGLGG